MIQKDHEQAEEKQCEPIYFMQSFASGVESELKAEFLSMANSMQFDLLEQEEFFQEEIQASSDTNLQDQNSDNTDA